MLIFQPPDPRFDCYLQYFRRVRHFSQIRKNIKIELPKSTKMIPKMPPGAIQNPSKNEAKKKHQQLTIWAPKIKPKWSQNDRKNSYGSTLGSIRKHFANADSIFLPFWGGSGRLLASVLTPFGHPGNPLWAPFGSL